MEGEPLDVGRLLYTRRQGSRASRFFPSPILNDAERMFFVSLLLNESLGWMRAQSGTTSLRAILYMDEIFGYFPPVANPPSKRRCSRCSSRRARSASGVVLATQNPVDLDYKGAVERRHLVHRPAADRARQGPRARRIGRRGRQQRRSSTARPMEQTARGLGQSCLSDEQRPRRWPGRLPDALGR